MSDDSDDKSGYWGSISGGSVAHWFVVGEVRDRSLCGVEMHPLAISAPWGRQRCKRCVRASVAMQQKEAQKTLRTMTEDDFREAHG